MAGILTGRLALVTGAGSGIGKAVSELFCKEGASVIGAGLNDVSTVIEKLTNIDKNIKHLAVEMDVSCEQEVSQMFKSIIQHYNRPPCIVVNCAGITQDSLLVKMTDSHFSKVLDVNLKGNFFIIKHLGQFLMEHKIRNASIINIASIVGKTGNIGQANYTASKAGVVALTKTTALEFARYGHRCNVVLPGFITTAMTEKVPSKVQEQVKSMIPLGEFGDPIDIANTCLFLASHQSRYITGTSIEVTGGLAM